MKTILIATALLTTLCACAGPRPLTRAEVPPASPRGSELAPNAPASTDESATQKWLDEEIARKRAGTAAATPPAVKPPAPTGAPVVQRPQPVQVAAQEPAPTNEEATRGWLDRTIEERRAAEPAPRPDPVVVRTVYVDRPVWRDDCDDRDWYGYGYDDYGQPIYARSYYRVRSRYESPFPVNTLVGAGLGAVIGHQSHHRDRGAAIGAGVGLLFDLARWSR